MAIAVTVTRCERAGGAKRLPKLNDLHYCKVACLQDCKMIGMDHHYRPFGESTYNAKGVLTSGFSKMFSMRSWSATRNARLLVSQGRLPVCLEQSDGGSAHELAPRKVASKS